MPYVSRREPHKAPIRPNNKVHLSIHNLITGWQTNRLMDERDAYKFITNLPEFCCEASRAGLICHCWFEIEVRGVVTQA